MSLMTCFDFRAFVSTQNTSAHHHMALSLTASFLGSKSATFNGKTFLLSIYPAFFSCLVSFVVVVWHISGNLPGPDDA